MVPKRPLPLSCPVKNFSNFNFNEHETAGNKVVLNWGFLLVNGKTKRAQKNSMSCFKTFKQFLAWRVSKGNWKTITVYYGFFNPKFDQFLQVSNSHLSVRVTL